MLFTKKTEKTTDNFWQEFEEKTGEKVLSRGLGKYISGWKEFDEKKWEGWGLVIQTTGGFHFHHFPQYSWIDNFTRNTENETIKEKTLFISKEKIISADTIKETKWWRKIFSSLQSKLVIRYIDETETERRLVFEADFNFL